MSTEGQSLTCQLRDSTFKYCMHCQASSVLSYDQLVNFEM